jgi:ribosomal-protein-alanine N-acetyltransferase
MSEILTTQRLRLRPIDVDDIDALHVFWTNPDVRRYLWDDKIIPREFVEEIVDRSQRSFAAHSYGFWAVELVDPATEGLIGFCGYRLFEDGEQVELLYGILPEFWGKGLGPEAGHEVLRRGFEHCGIDRVIAATDTPNQRSVRVLQRLGMTFDCRREFHGLDTVFYSMARDEFEELQRDS